MEVMTDDTALLDRLLNDMVDAEPCYRPTHYWQPYVDRLTRTIREVGVVRFRALYEPLFMSFGVTHVPDLLVPEFSRSAYRELTGVKRAVFSVLNRSGVLPRLVSNHVESHIRTFNAFRDACFHLAAARDDDGEILRISDSGLGEPRDLFCPENHEGVQYTLAFLRYFMDYLWVRRVTDFHWLKSVLELGSGYRGQAEVILKLYPDVRYVLCDIPPQVYVAEQYLKAVFPGEVSGYLETAAMPEIDLGRTRRITIMAPWQLEHLVGNVDLFWNSASFQEMEPDVVANYAHVIQPHVERYVYLKQYPGGQVEAARDRDVGVISKTTREDYKRLFSELTLIRESDAVQISSESPRGNPYINSEFYDYMLFERK